MLHVCSCWCHICFFKPTSLLPKLQKELLVKDEGHATDLLHLSLCCGVPVDKVSRDGDGQLPSKLFAAETCREGNKNISSEPCREETYCMQTSTPIFKKQVYTQRRSHRDTNASGVNHLRRRMFNISVISKHMHKAHIPNTPGQKANKYLQQLINQHTHTHILHLYFIIHMYQNVVIVICIWCDFFWSVL